MAMLEELDLPETDDDPRLNEIVNDVARHYDVAYAAISIVEDDRQWFKAKHGFDIHQTPIYDSICRNVVGRDLPVIIHNALFDPNYNLRKTVTHFPHIRFYCGCPLKLQMGIRIGSLCIFDPYPRPRFTLNDAEYLIGKCTEATEIIRHDAWRRHNVPA